MSKTTTQEPNMSTSVYQSPEEQARSILRHHKNHGGGVAILHGNRHIRGTVLTAGRSQATILDWDTNQIVPVGYQYIEELEEL